MCGIFCSLSRSEYIPPLEGISELLHARGPDATNQACVQSETEQNTESAAYITLYSTVLSLRGSVTVQQPYRREDSRSFLCWNGEAWSIAGERPDGNDTARIFRLIENAARQPIPPMDAREEIACSLRAISQALSQVAGPYAFVFHDPIACRTYFGRDFLGRRSLLRRVTAQGDVLLSSVTNGVAGTGWSEIEADAIYCLDLSGRSYGRDHQGDDFQKWGDFVVAKASHVSPHMKPDDITSVGLRHPP